MSKESLTPIDESLLGGQKTLVVTNYQGQKESSEIEDEDVELPY